MTMSDRITIDPLLMGGMPCIRGMCVTVNAIDGLMTSGATSDEILADYPYLEPDDISAALSYADGIKLIADGSGTCPSRKPRPNHQRTLRILRSMSPQQKMAQVFKLNDRTLKLFRVGLRRRFPELNDAEFEKVYLQMRERCHNRIY